MKWLIPVLVIALAAPALAATAVAPTEPEFAWGAKCSRAVKAELEQARKNWQEADAVPTTPPCLRAPKQARFDEAYLHELIGRADQAAVAYNLLDVSVRKLGSLDGCKASYDKAASAAGTVAPDTAKRFEESYCMLRSRIELAVGLARAAVARQMTQSETSGYCFQAMESAIDALQNAAADGRKAPGGEKRSEAVLKLRSTLFETWERAQSAKDASLIGEIDLPKAFDASGLLSRTAH